MRRDHRIRGSHPNLGTRVHVDPIREAAGLIGELGLLVAPVLLGEGERIFDGVTTPETTLTPLAARVPETDASRGETP